MKILSLHQTKQKGPIWCQNQTIIQPFLFSKFISNRNEKNKKQIFMHKPVYLGLSILEICKIVMHEFWYLLCEIWRKIKSTLHGYK